MPAKPTVAARNQALRAKRTGTQTTKNRGAEVRTKNVNTSNNTAAALVDPDKPLTEMQKSFVKHWASGETLLAASVKAGYADGGTYAYRMARMPNILALYHEEKLAFERASDMSRKKVIDGFMDGVNMAMMLGEPASVIAGWREIGKMCGYYAPIEVKQTVTHEGKVLVDRMNQLSDADLMRLIEQRAEELANDSDKVDGT